MSCLISHSSFALSLTFASCWGLIPSSTSLPILLNERSCSKSLIGSSSINCYSFTAMISQSSCFSDYDANQVLSGKEEVAQHDILQFVCCSLSSTRQHVFSLSSSIICLSMHSSPDMLKRQIIIYCVLLCFDCNENCLWKVRVVSLRTLSSNTLFKVQSCQISLSKSSLFMQLSPCLSLLFIIAVYHSRFTGCRTWLHDYMMDTHVSSTKKSAFIVEKLSALLTKSRICIDFYV